MTGRNFRNYVQPRDGRGAVRLLRQVRRQILTLSQGKTATTTTTIAIRSGQRHGRRAVSCCPSRILRAVSQAATRTSKTVRVASYLNVAAVIPLITVRRERENRRRRSPSAVHSEP